MKSPRQYKAKKQLDKANSILQLLAINVTADDKKEVIEQNDISRYTVNSYLKGEAKDLSIAMDLIRFFRKKVSEREKELASTV